MKTRFASLLLAFMVGVSLSLLGRPAQAESTTSVSTEPVFSSPTSWLSLKPQRFGGSYFGWFFMNGEAANRGNPDDSFSIQNFGLTYKTENDVTWGLWYASTLSRDEQGQSEYEAANPYIEVNKFGWLRLFGDVTVSAMAQLYLPATEEWRRRGTTEVFGFAWINKPLSKNWEVEYHLNPRYSHHRSWRETTTTTSGTTVEGLPGFLYLQELKARYLVNSKLKAFQLVGLQTEWRHRGANSESFAETFEVETGIEFAAHRYLWLQASVRQNISERPYLRGFKLYSEDQTEYHLRLSANM